jgi:hypothetical protein
MPWLWIAELAERLETDALSPELLQDLDQACAKERDAVAGLVRAGFVETLGPEGRRRIAAFPGLAQAVRTHFGP